jgi:4-oxalocrotonate tautomerase
MPIVKVLMYGGRSQQQKDDLARAITDAVENIAKAPRDQTIVVIQEVAKEHYYIGAKRSS